MTDQSANQVDALAVSRVGTDIVLRWRVRQDNGREFRVWFTRADTGVTYALNAVPLSSSTRVMTLDSQALAAPCGDFHLTQLLAGGTDTGPSLPVTLPVGPGGCGGGGDPPPPPPDGIHWVTRWRHLDHLGSLRLMTDESGWVVSGSQIDYYPFGMPMDAMPPSSWLFTGHEKDAATGLDYMLARMHSASVGSFTSVDPARGSAKADSPRTWNRYAYVQNSPVVLTDPTGRDVRIKSGLRPDDRRRLVTAFAKALRNEQFRADAGRLEQSPRRYVVGTADLPDKTTKDGRKVVSYGHTEPDAGGKKKVLKNLKGAEITIDLKAIDASKGTGDPKSDVEVLAHEAGGHAALLEQPEKYKDLLGEKVQEDYALEYGKDVAADPATKAAPTPGEYAEAAKMLNLEDVTETRRQEANDPRKVLGQGGGE